MLPPPVLDTNGLPGSAGVCLISFAVLVAACMHIRL